MRQFSICLILLGCLLQKSFRQRDKPLVVPPLPSYHLDLKDSDRYAFFTYDAKRDQDNFKGDCKPATLSKKELIRIEELIKIRVAIYNKGNRKINKPQKYYKQFVAVINNNGEKEVWVNCCCEAVADWKKKIQIVFDGGSCYFDLTINLDKNIVSDFRVMR